MFTKPEQLTSVAVARPMRVAYLIDLDDAPDALFDEINLEAYGRWGGRRTLIAPAKPAGIDPRYLDWATYFDADIIYSFVKLDDAVVADLHELLGPAFLRFHEDRRRSGEAERSFSIRLPMAGVSSLSVLPAYASRSWTHEGPPRNIKVLTKFWDRGESSFLQENFGLVSASFMGGAIASEHPDLFSGMTLITQESLDNKHYAKDERAVHVTSEAAVLDALGAQMGPLTLAQLSEWFSPYLETEGMSPEGTYLVAGDSAADRMLFWNVHHRFRRGSLSDITALRVPVGRLTDGAFIGELRKLLERRGVHGYNNRNDHVGLVSCSVDAEELEAFAERLRKAGHWLAVRVQRLDDASELNPAFGDPTRVHFAQGGYMAEPEGRATAEFHGNRAPAPLAMPWHMKEAMPPRGLREGVWMANVTIDRMKDHCRYAGQRDVWRLPRRLRMERGFPLETEGDRDPTSAGNVQRVMRSGSIGVGLKVEMTRAAISIPEDLEALRIGICNSVEWHAFEQSRKDAPHGRPRFAYAAPSDKGRYLLGVLGRFETLPEAFGFLMHGYWREVLLSFGGLPAERDPELLSEVKKKVSRRVGPLPVTLSKEDDVERVARIAVQLRRKTAPRYRSYGSLLADWKQMVEEFLAAHPSPDETSDNHYRDERSFDEQLQELCQRGLLYQGREWRCGTCYNRNWVGISELEKTLRCAVCRREEAAPVSGDWQFKADPFVIEAYRDSGTEAVIWALWRLWDGSERSFYFAPSMDLWLKYPTSREDGEDAEIDALAVVDGKVHQLEAKSAARLDEKGQVKLILAAERIRPDVVVIATMERVSGSLQRVLERIRANLPKGVELQVLTFDPKDLERTPYVSG
jgi:hypothetical protein